MPGTEGPNRQRVTGRKRVPSVKTAIAAITHYRRLLTPLGVRRDILESLDRAVELLRDRMVEQGDLFNEADVSAKPLDALTGRHPTELSSSELWELINSDEVPRKTLERIAIERFSVPIGSMRSYPNIGLLQEKLRTLVRNDEAHRTISAVSQRTANR